MIQVSYDELGKSNTQQAIMKLCESEFRDMEGFRATKIAKAAREAFFKMREEFKSEIQEKYATKDDKGMPMRTSTGKAAEMGLPFQCSDDDAAKVKEALDAFGKRVVEIKHKKLSLEGLFRVNAWTPNDLEGLAYFYDEPCEEAESNVKPIRN